MEYYREKMQHRGGLGFREYVDALEKERTKIQVFERELPLCLELVTQGIYRLLLLLLLLLFDGFFFFKVELMVFGGIDF
jgi:hypothetical protein